MGVASFEKEIPKKLGGGGGEVYKKKNRKGQIFFFPKIEMEIFIRKNKNQWKMKGFKRPFWKRPRVIISFFLTGKK